MHGLLCFITGIGNGFSFSLTPDLVSFKFRFFSILKPWWKPVCVALLWSWTVFFATYCLLVTKFAVGSIYHLLVESWLEEWLDEARKIYLPRVLRFVVIIFKIYMSAERASTVSDLIALHPWSLEGLKLVSKIFWTVCSFNAGNFIA